MKHTMMRRLLATLLALCALMLLSVSCGEEEAPQKVDYTMTVLTEGGMPLVDVRVTVYKDSSKTAMVWAADTDENGVIAFTANKSGDYVAVLENVPAGYQVEESYPVAVQSTVTLETALPDGGDLSAHSFQLGDVMCDFSVSMGFTTDPTASAPPTVTLSELLEKHKAVVLNFWFLNCGPCRMEFPYLQEAYAAKDENVEVIAINPVDGNAAKVAAYAADNGLTFPMVVGDSAWAQAMQLTAYPTTVVIDRYGMIAMIHKGFITEAETFEAIFDYFTSDDYVQTTVESIADLL